jgi:tetratricopeptide (TPR) repeat protein
MKILIYSFFGLVLLIIAGCESDNGTTPTEYTAQELTEQGWDLFATVDYQRALEKFEEAISKETNYVEAYAGAGWASARLTNLASSVSYFSSCISLNSSYEDGHAGLAFVYNAQKHYLLAITSANSALSQNSTWFFQHDETLNHNDLHLLLAECYFALLNFENCLAQVKILNTSFTADITTYDGRAALAAEIERLRGIV